MKSNPARRMPAARRIASCVAFAWASQGVAASDGSPLWFPDDPTRGHNPVQASNFAGEEIAFVDRSAPDGGDGSTWATAFNDLQSAFAVSGSVGEIRVATGVYTPDAGMGDRDAQFLVLGARDLLILGGFPAGGGDLVERDPTLHPTVLSGDLAGDDSVSLDGGGRVVFANTDDNSRRILDISGSSASLIIDGFTIRGGHSSTDGGGLLAVNSLARIRSVRFEACSAASRGGGAFVDSFVLLSPSFEDCVFSRCGASRGGALGAAVVEFRLSGCVFDENSADGGGAVAITATQGRESAVVVFDSSSFTANISGFEHGGGILAEEGVSVEAVDCQFSGNATQTIGGAVCGTGLGRFERCSFVENRASLGGAIWEVREVVASTFQGNACDEDGGAVYGIESVRNSHFSGNTAGRSGGAILSADVVFNCEFIGNAAEDNRGGAITGGQRIELCRFKSNTARLGGAASDVIEMDRCEFVRNSAGDDGGATYFCRDIRRCEFDENSAGRDGGAVYRERTNGFGDTIECTFRGNLSLRDGGAHWGGRGSVHRSLFIGNHAAAQGGGLAGGNGNPDDLAIDSCLFSGNTAGLIGGAIAETDTNIVNCTITGNYAPSGGGVSASEPARIRNCVLWGNNSPGLPLEQQQIGGTFHEVRNSIIEGIADYFGTGNSGANPDFRDPLGSDGMPGTGDEDYTPKTGSPAIDAGDEAVPASAEVERRDARGRPRLIAFTADEARIDIGAYEAQDCDADLLEDREAVLGGYVPDCNDDLLPDACQIGGPAFGRLHELFVTDTLRFEAPGRLVSTDGTRIGLSSGWRSSQNYYDQRFRILADRGDGWLVEAVVEAAEELDSEIGYESAFDGERVAFAASSFDGLGFRTLNGIYVAERIGGAWVIEERLDRGFQPNIADARIGVVDISDNLVVSGWRSFSSSDYASIDVWTRDAGQWSYSGFFGRDDWSIGSRLGIHLQIFEDRILAGAPGRLTSDTIEVGAIGVYRRSDSGWDLEEVIEPPEPVPGNFGIHFAIQGDTMVVGAPNHERASGTGVAHLYLRTNGAWEFAETIAPREGDDAAEFGQTVGIDGRRVVISSERGARVYVFDREDRSRFEVLQQAAGVRSDNLIVSAGGTLAIITEIGPVSSIPETSLKVYEDSLADENGDGIPDRCSFPCNGADGAAPYGTLDLADITAFLGAFSDQSSGADLAPPSGVYDLADIAEFLNLFLGGCP